MTSARRGGPAQLAAVMLQSHLGSHHRHPAGGAADDRRRSGGGERAFFYTIVARDTVDQMFALNRQRFLAEQGYDYDIIDAHEL